MTRRVGILVATALALSPGRITAQRATPDSAAELGLFPRSVRVTAAPALAVGRAEQVAATMSVANSVDAPARAPSRRSPLVAGALGFILPGGGHFYAGEARRGWLVFGVTMVGAFFALTDGTPRAAATAGSVAFVGGWAFSVVDGSLAATRYNRRHQN